MPSARRTSWEPHGSRVGANSQLLPPRRHFETTTAALAALRNEGVPVVCMETTEDAVSYAAYPFPPSGVALVLGNEETGVDTRVMQAAQGVIEIPTFGLKNSLNVAAAAPIVVFEILRQWGSLE